LKISLTNKKLKDLNTSLYLHAFGALVLLTPGRKVRITSKNSQTGGKTNGRSSNSQARVQFSTTMLILKTPSLRTGTK